MIDITKTALVLYIDIIIGQDNSIFKIYNDNVFELIKSNTNIHMWPVGDCKKFWVTHVIILNVLGSLY
jgi:hypothetical protein